MKSVINVNISTEVNNISRQMIDMISVLQDTEHALKGMHTCEHMKTDAVECQIDRSQVRLVWQLQYELADVLAIFSGHFGMVEQAKGYTETALGNLQSRANGKQWST